MGPGLRHPAPNFLIDLPYLRIICVAPDGDLPPERSGTLSPATLAWLEQRLKRAPGKRDCWIACHWPLHKTVLGVRAGSTRRRCATSTPSPTARSGPCWPRNPNAKAWISGHTHSPLDAPGLVTRASCRRGRSILSINLSAIAGVGKVREQSDPIRSLYLTHLPGKVEIRFRDHGARRWMTVRGNRVQTVRV